MRWAPASTDTGRTRTPWISLACLTLAIFAAGCHAGHHLQARSVHALPETSRQFPLVAGKVALYLNAVPKRVTASQHDFTVELVIVNGLGRSFSLPDACDGWLLVDLASGPNVFEPGNGLVGCAPQIVPAGTTRVSRQVGMTYDGCDQDPKATPSATTPLCGGRNHDEMPLLPPGRYRLQPDTYGVPHPIVPDPVTVILDKT